MVIQIQFRYSQLTRLQHWIGPGEQPGPQERVAIYLDTRLIVQIYSSGFWNRHSCRNRRDRSAVPLLRGDPAPPAQPQQNY